MKNPDLTGIMAGINDGTKPTPDRMLTGQMMDMKRGTVCYCDKPKQAWRAFCDECFYKLPKELRADLFARFGEGYEGAFRAALLYLFAPMEFEEAGEKKRNPYYAELKEAPFDVRLGPDTRRLLTGVCGLILILIGSAFLYIFLWAVVPDSPVRKSAVVSSSR